MIRLVIAVVLVGVAIAVALIIERRRPAPPTQPTWAVPSQLDRDDFDRPDAPWLIVVFTLPHASAMVSNSCSRVNAGFW